MSLQELRFVDPEDVLAFYFFFIRSFFGLLSLVQATLTSTEQTGPQVRDSLKHLVNFL